MYLKAKLQLAPNSLIIKSAIFSRLLKAFKFVSAIYENDKFALTDLDG